MLVDPTVLDLAFLTLASGVVPAIAWYTFIFIYALAVAACFVIEIVVRALDERAGQTAACIVVPFVSRLAVINIDAIAMASLWIPCLDALKAIKL